jgi:hypothetical protein
VGGIHRQLNTDVGDSNADGVYSGVQLRTLLSDSIEGNFDVTYNYLDGANFGGASSAGNSWVYGFTGLFAVTDSVALKTVATIDDESLVTLTGGVRLAF